MKIIEHSLLNPLSDKHKYYKYIKDNPYSVGNKHKREQCAFMERYALHVQSQTKDELISMLKTWSSNAFINANYEMKVTDIWAVVRLIKRGLQLHKKSTK